MSLNVFAILALIASCSIAATTGMCQVQLTADSSARPKVLKKIGNRRVQVPNKTLIINLSDAEEVSLQCDTSFIHPSARSGESTIDFICNGQQYFGYYEPQIFECDSLKWNLYELSIPFSWCPFPMESYALAHSKSGGGYTILAGVCYNFEEMSIQSIHYVMAEKVSQYLAQIRFREYTPTTKIENVADNFVSRDILPSTYENAQIRNWMNFARYDRQSLIQNVKLHESFTQLGGLLDVAWWSGLRLGNWPLYEEALNKHIEAEGYEYDILAGISGAVAAPIYKEICHKNRSFVEIIDDANTKLPLYVWHYLKSTRHESDNVVVIGVNSPFYEFYKTEDIVFCKDICAEIDWLQKVYSTFHYRAMGVIFCCSVDEVKASKRLNGFPQPINPIIRNLHPIVHTTTPTYEVLDRSTEAEDLFVDDILH